MARVHGEEGRVLDEISNGVEHGSPLGSATQDHRLRLSEHLNVSVMVRAVSWACTRINVLEAGAVLGVVRGHQVGRVRVSGSGGRHAAHKLLIFQISDIRDEDHSHGSVQARNIDPLFLQNFEILNHSRPDTTTIVHGRRVRQQDSVPRVDVPAQMRRVAHGLHIYAIDLRSIQPVRTNVVLTEAVSVDPERNERFSSQVTGDGVKTVSTSKVMVELVMPLVPRLVHLRQGAHYGVYNVLALD